MYYLLPFKFSIVNGKELLTNDFGDFLFVQRQNDLGLSALAADNGQKAEADVVDAVLTVQHGGNGQSGVSAGEQALADVAYGQGYRVERRALSLDDAAAGLAHVFFHFVVRVRGKRQRFLIGN